ncbi:MAG: uracil phosphoribosyltransferase, partial [Gammaproteobacteria bacterium]|nr:uracil phosphoribosyltransferase [Gammaproteobacteria bacterium]
MSTSTTPPAAASSCIASRSCRGASDRGGAVPDRPHLRVLGHPLVGDKVTRLRDHRTGHREFRDLIREIGSLMAYEVLRDLPAEEVEVETPLETTTGLRVREEDIVLVPILRAGLGMLEGFTAVLPGARVGHVGLYRDHATLQPVQYYFNVPRPAGPPRRGGEKKHGTGGGGAAARTRRKGPGAPPQRGG